MFNSSIQRIGFACKYSELKNGKITSVPGLNTSGTTITWLGNQTRDVAEQRLWDTLEENITNVRNMVKRVGDLEPGLRMVRIGSDILTAYTHSNWEYFYKRPDVIARMETLFSKIGEHARSNDVRLSFHPGQFTVLASEDPDIVNRSIAEFEYHADMARMMGFGQQFQDCKINVHISGRLGPEGVRAAYTRLTPEARNCITIENEENSWGLDDCISLCDILPIVLDIHHHWIREGEYISATDKRIAVVRDSWRGVRPTVHYSVSREDYLVGHDCTISPDRDALIEAGHKKQKLRAHSDYMWNKAVNDWAKTHWAWADLMVEAKAKNLASHSLYEYYTNAV